MTSRFNPLAVAAFEAFFRPWRDRRVRTLMAGLPADLPPDVPLLLAGNHTSWWDPFTLREMQRALRPSSPVFVVMLERELARRPYFRRMGVHGIEPGSGASLRACVRQLRERLAERPDGTVVFFPQGRIWPSFKRPLGFHPGVGLLARELAPLVVIPVALHVEPLSSTRATVFASAAEPIHVRGALSPAELEAAVTAELDALLAFLALHGEDAPAHWPGPRGRLPTAPRMAEAT
jgi:1-acyl-sn-glycerol-3-phosphate acyltransferase